MDIPQKLTFIHELINHVKNDITRQVSKMPEDWDGIELRWYISERFSEVVHRRTDKRSKRYQDYHNFVITTGI